MLAPTPFFFKKAAPAAVVLQRNISRAEVETPSISLPADIVALYQMEDNNANTDPNGVGIYGEWTATSREYRTHVGVLNDNGFSRYLYNSGLQINGWGVGAADTYYNLGGMTFSWIGRVTPTLNARLLQFWQADIENIDVYFSSLTEITVSVILGSGTQQTAVANISASGIDNSTFHHFVVSFNPASDRICRLYFNGNVIASTPAVTGTVVFGDTAVNIRRGIAFGSHYSSPNVNVAGDVDHCTILRGFFEPVDPGGENLMMHEGNFMKYFTDQMLYNPAS